MSDDITGGIEIVATTTVVRAERMARSLRMTESLLTRLLEDSLLPEGEDVEETMMRRVELSAIARWIEKPAAAVRGVSELPRHQRPKKQKTKMVWCTELGCGVAVALKDADETGLCPACRSVKEKLAGETAGLSDDR